MVPLGWQGLVLWLDDGPWSSLYDWKLLNFPLATA